MSPEFRSLLMKEWSERRSLFRLGLVLVVAFLGYCVAYEFEYRTRALIASYYSTCLMTIPLGAVLLAMSTATGEYSRRTLKFSASLPVSLSKVAWARLIGAWACLVVPIVCGAIIVTLLLATGLVEQAGLRADSVSLLNRPSLSRFAAIGFLWTTTAVSVAYTLHLSTLLSLVGTRCRNEGTVGFIGVVVALFSMIFVEARPMLDRLDQYFLSDWVGGLLPASLAICWGYGELDGSSYTDLELAPLVFGPVTVSLLITAALATWFTRWYGSRVDVTSQPAKSWRRWLPRIGMPSLAARLGIRWPGRFAALTWLNARQSVPLSLAGLLIAVVITLIGLSESPSGGTVATRMADRLPSSTWSIGTLWAAVVAVGIFSSELKPGLEQFWRSRPISPGQWFWMKFSVGLIAVVGTLDLLPALLAWGPQADLAPDRTNDTQTSQLAYLACMPLVHAEVYAVAVAAVCRLRRPIPAAIFALVLFFVIDAVLQSIPGQEHLSTIEVHNSLVHAEKTGGRLDLTSAGYPIVYGIVVAVIIGATVLARRTLIPPRALRRLPTTAILFGLCYAFCSANAQAAEPPTAADILAGIHQRDALVKDVRMRLSTKLHRTPAFFAQVEQAKHSRRRTGAVRDLPDHQEVTQAVTYELFESLPRRASTKFSPDGAASSTTAFDGKVFRRFSLKNLRSSSRGAAMAMPEVPFSPQEALMSCDGTSPENLHEIASPEDQPMSNEGLSLTHLLGMAKLTDVVQREVDREQLIDFTMRQTINDVPSVGPNGWDITPVSQNDRYTVTVNASRHYWPIKVVHEVSQSSDGTILSRDETTAEGWIDAGLLVYPRKVTRLNSVVARTSNGQLMRNNDAANTQKLEHVITNESEILEIAVNTDLPDSIFAPAFPTGSVIQDAQDGKTYEVTAAGTEQLYHPKPKGLRGAVFGFHLLWMAIATTWLLRRKVTH